MMTTISCERVDIGSLIGESCLIGATDGKIHLIFNHRNPDWNDDRELTPEVAEKLGQELIRAAQKAKPRRRYRMA